MEPGKYYRILIADDEDDFTSLLAEYLRPKIKGEIAVAKDGHEAIEKARTFHPDLILLDIMMPGCDGFKALAEIRKDNASSTIILCSSEDNFSSEQFELASANIFMFLKKPIKLEELCALIMSALN
jgi:CheY-like chemotaxis protein